MSLSPGAILSHFEIKKPIDQGAMGIVYLAEDRSLAGRRVAIKVVSPALTHVEVLKARLVDEASLAAAIPTHPNIVTVFELGQTPETFFIVMEYVDGGSLAKRLVASGVPPIATAVRYAQDILEGLRQAHTSNILHGDLKPDNIMITSRDTVKLLDFGLARLIRESLHSIGATDPTLPSVHVPIAPGGGTVAYMSPEQIGREHLTGPSDLFSFGVVLYEMITGQHPFMGENPGAILQAIQHRAPLAPSALRPGVPPELEGIILKCLEKKVEDRYGSADEVLEDLLEVTSKYDLPFAAESQLDPNRFGGVCLVCGDNHNRFNLTSSGRLCTAPGCVGQEWPENMHSRLVTILPDWKVPLDVRALPSLTGGAIDTLAKWADEIDLLPSGPSILAAEPDAARLKQMFPYSEDYLGDTLGMRCGNAVCYRARRLETWIGHPCVCVLDMSTYRLSGTLKDPRSWAIVNLAVEMGIKHLAAWTAGNAGLSLGRLVRLCNHFLPANRRIVVYALYAHGDDSIDECVESALRTVECELISVPSAKEKVESPDEVMNRVRDRAGGMRLGRWNDADYWDVTDGWEAVGSLMYRMVFSQVIAALRPTEIVAPLGTGNLVVGILGAIEDCERSGIEGFQRPLVCGAVPHDDANILREIARQRGRGATLVSADKGKRPLMPKIAGTYTPLYPVIELALREGGLEPCEVEAEDQARAREKLLGPALGRRIIAEPSAIAPFAALPKVGGGRLRGARGGRVLVINSGCGVLSRMEQRFLVDGVRAGAGT